MENQIQTSRQSEISNQITTIQEIETASKGKLIKDCNDEEIKQALRYILTLLGLRANLIPQDEAKEVLIYFIKKRLWLLKIDELRLSFEYAIEKRTGVELSLFGDTFSAKIVLEVVEAYQKYKKSSLSKAPKNEIGMNNYERKNKVFEFLNDETKEYLKKIGSVEKKEKSKLPILPYHDIHQKWLRQFDKLKLTYEVPDCGGRFINRYGKIINVEEYFKIKADQLHKANERKNASRNKSGL